MDKVELIDAGSCFYGIPSGDFVNPKDLKKPIQFHFGDKDMVQGFSDIKAADKLMNDLKAAGNLNVTEVRHIELSYTAIKRAGTIAEFHRYKDGEHGKILLNQRS